MRQPKPTAPIPCLLLLTVAAACSSSDSAPAPPLGASGAGASGDGGAMEAGWSCAKEPSVDLSGSWAALLDLQLNLSSQQGGTATLCPEQQTDRATIVLALRISHALGSATIEAIEPTFCSIQLPALSANVGQCDPASDNKLTVDLLLSEPLLAALPSIPIAKVAGSLDSAKAGAAFLSERFVMTAGTRKLGADMPSWLGSAQGCGVTDTSAGRGAQCDQACVDDCAAMLDDDADGRTGVTFHVCGYSADDIKSAVKCKAETPSEAAITIQGPVFMDFQVDPLLQGAALSSCELRGTVDTQVIYHVVGGDIYVANSQIAVLSAMKSLPLFSVDKQQSRFRMVRIDGAHGAPD